MTRRQPRDLFTVFPAHAGVIPLVLNIIYLSEGIPRTRGGDPEFDRCRFTALGYSPHTRG